MRTLVTTLVATLSLGPLVASKGSDDKTCKGENCNSDDTGGAEEITPRNLVAIGYDNELGVNQLHSIDVETGVVETLLSFTFGAGWWWPGVVSDSDNGVIYCVDGDETLYRIAMDGSDIEAVGTLSLSMQAMDMGPDGLLGIGYSTNTGYNYLRSVDPETAEVTNLTSFEFDSGSWEVVVVNDIAAGGL